ncbi:MAG: hypothetical protein Q7S14_01410 [bacterium]|nr:hypothetical protein [bacterium]
MAKSHVIEVECKCGQPLARYFKDIPGLLIKMYLSEIRIDRAGIFLKEPPLQNGIKIFCPKCQKLVANVAIIHGRPAARLNQGTVKKIRV